jgi:ectoine hydroxylase-related dioxygenase (phytanoyl-CoA dioxygenase family)
MPTDSKLDHDGYESFGPVADQTTITTLRESVFISNKPGTRCLLDDPHVHAVAVSVRDVLVRAGRLPANARAIQAIAFDKTTAANWKVTWHQDLMFPFARAVTAEGYALPSQKDGVNYARPPRDVLAQLLAVRIHLDDCDETNGPLRVSPATHCLGIIPSAAIAETVARHGEHACLAKAGEALLMKPLILHASSQAIAPKHRRVLHLVYSAAERMTEPWHREV